MNDRSGDVVNHGPNPLLPFVGFINAKQDVRPEVRGVTSGAALAVIVERHAASAGVSREAAREFAASIALFDEWPGGQEVITELCRRISGTTDDIALRLVPARGSAYSLESTPDGLEVSVPAGRWCRRDLAPAAEPSSPVG